MKAFGIGSTNHLAVKTKTDQDKTPNISQNNQSVSNFTATNQTIQYFSFRLKNGTSESTPTIAWTYNVPVLSPNQRSLFLATQTFQTVLQQFVGQNYPQTISIGLANYGGFIGSDGVQTNKIIVLNLSYTSVYQSNGVVMRDLVYKSDTSAQWNLGQLRNLNLMVYLDEQTTPINFPIVNSVALSFKIIHLAI